MPSVLRRAEAGDWSTRVTWSWWEAAAVMGGAFVVADQIRDRSLGPSSSLGAAFLGRILVESAWLAVVMTWLLVRRHSWRVVLGRSEGPRSEIVDASVFGALLNGIVVVVLILPLRAMLVAAVGGDVEASSTDLRSLSAPGVTAALGFALVVAPIVEEFVFRGVVFRGVRDRHGLVAGVAVSALAFGAIHWVPFASTSGALAAAGTTAMGVGLAIQYERRRTLLAPIVAHVSFNAVGLLAALR